MNKIGRKNSSGDKTLRLQYSRKLRVKSSKTGGAEDVIKKNQVSSIVGVYWQYKNYIRHRLPLSFHVRLSPRADTIVRDKAVCSAGDPDNISLWSMGAVFDSSFTLAELDPTPADTDQSREFLTNSGQSDRPDYLLVALKRLPKHSCDCRLLSVPLYSITGPPSAYTTAFINLVPQERMLSCMLILN
ncbi:hypothetical protein RRG08_024387 [Elysia crispata]|uniref:Uncharacterized protein n=1 Tax=Elysia crispata TaxID=231223 RepID=A0AAE0ZMN0_9GAST|nr:hypothetical protein RRG08_024387 [Elysia crispata]